MIETRFSQSAEYSRMQSRYEWPDLYHYFLSPRPRHSIFNYGWDRDYYFTYVSQKDYLRQRQRQVEDLFSNFIFRHCQSGSIFFQHYGINARRDNSIRAANSYIIINNENSLFKLLFSIIYWIQWRNGENTEGFI